MEFATNQVSADKEIKYLESEIRNSLTLEALLVIQKGLKVIFEDLIILLIWSSALYKMNLVSIVDICLVVKYHIKRGTKTIRFISNFKSILLLLRLCLILTNMNSNV